MPRNTLPFLIAGGGIGGLAAALGLARKGYRSIVLERARGLGEIGAGIQIGPNAFHAFDYLGIGDAARAKAVYIDQLILMDALKDERIASIPLDEPFRKRFRNPYAVVHRADLHMVLLDACRASDLIELRTRSAVEWPGPGQFAPDRRVRLPPDYGRAALRNTVLRSSTAEQHYDRIAWLYGVTGLGATV
jgi:glycine/D-amino acid oxidase-like deaminating enzyme